MQVPRQFLSKKPIKNGANRQMCACVGTSHFILLVLSISSEMVAIRRVTQGSAAPSIDHGTARARNTMLGVAGALVVCVVVLSLMMKHSKRRRVTGVCTRTQTADEGVKTCAFFYCVSNEQHVHWHDVDVKLGRQHTTVQQSFSGMIRLPPSNSVQRQDILQGPGGWLNQPGPTYNHKLAQTDCRIATRCFEKILIAHSLLVDKSWGRVWPVEWIDDHKADMYRGPFDDITNIADCSNTQTKQPSRNHAEKKALYSSYYSMTCGKWAVSMSPVGLVSWVSKMYAGCTSDQRIIVDSNIWGAMYPGRTLLYDKGGGLLDQLAHKMGYGYACPYRMVEGDLTHCEQRASHALSTRRAPVERLIGWIKKRCMAGSYILHRQDFCLADDVLKVCSFFQHFDGPIAFNKQYGDSDVAIPLLTEDLSDIAGGTNNSSDGFDDDDDWDSEEEPLSDSGGSDEGEL